MNPKVTWSIMGIVAALALGLLASRVGNIGARSVRSGHTPVTLSLSEPILAGVPVRVSWPTALGQSSGPVVLKARARNQEVVVGTGEFGAGQAMVTVPCELGGEQVGVDLYMSNENGIAQLVSQDLADVLPAGPDCLR